MHDIHMDILARKLVEKALTEALGFKVQGNISSIALLAVHTICSSHSSQRNAC